MEEIKLKSSKYDSVLILETSLGNLRLNFLIDCGANINFISKDVSKILEKDAKSTFKKSGISKTLDSSGQYFESNIYNFKGSFLGRKNTQLLFQDIDQFVLDGIQFDEPIYGILGLDFLINFNCILDFKNRILKYNKKNV